MKDIEELIMLRLMLPKSRVYLPPDTIDDFIELYKHLLVQERIKSVTALLAFIADVHGYHHDQRLLAGMNFAYLKDCVSVLEEWIKLPYAEQVTQHFNVESRYQAIINQWVNEKESDYLILNIAVRYKRIEIIKELIKANVDVNYGSVMLWTPLLEAANSASPEIVRTLIAAGADVNKGGFNNLSLLAYTTPFDEAISAKHWEAAYELTLHGARGGSEQFSEQFVEYLMKATPEVVQSITTEMLKKFAYFEFKDSSSPYKNALSFATILMNKGATTDYATLMEHRKVHTLSAFYGFPLLCTLGNIKPGSPEAMRLYGRVQQLRIGYTGDQSDSAKAKILAFADVTKAQDTEVAKQLAKALNVRYTRGLFSTPSPTIPADMPPEIRQKLQAPSMR